VPTFPAPSPRPRPQTDAWTRGRARGLSGGGATNASRVRRNRTLALASLPASDAARPRARNTLRAGRFRIEVVKVGVPTSRVETVDQLFSVRASKPNVGRAHPRSRRSFPN
jgi:hypothetical protein